MAETGDRAHTKPCTLIHPTSPPHCTTLQLDLLLQHLARQAADDPSKAPGSAIVDCSSLIHLASASAPAPALYALWITRVSTPSLFSLTCVGEHIRKQLTENGGKVVVSIFNDAGGYGEVGEALAAGTHMAVFKRIDWVKGRCVPVSFSTREKNAIKEYVVRFQASAELEGKEED